MCGIAGVISKTNSISVKERVYAMSQSIKHRGPDGEGFVFISSTAITPAFSSDTPIVNKESQQFKFNAIQPLQSLSSNYNIAFAHRRLSIIDLSESGHQPMCDISGDYWITFNGEVYNYIELREELKNKGHNFLTQTDTEVVVAAYKEWGENCLQKFNGMFAFVLFDKIKNQLFCARDRVGVKPFYYINTNNVFAFASEYKAFIKSGLINFEINEEHQFDYLINANLETQEESLFKGIKELKPSHYFIYNLNTHHINLTEYYNISSTVIAYKTDKEIIDLVEEKVVNAIKLRLRSDVEVGSCLSGGLDSSIIAGVIKNVNPTQTLKLFTAVFPTEKFDESNYAKSVSDFVKGDWKTVTPTATDFFREIETLNYFQDIPVWSTSTYSQHRVMQLAKESGVKVVLDGQGADELFGGYAHHYYSYWKENLGLQTFNQINQASLTVNKPFQLFIKQQLKEHLSLKQNYSVFFTDKVNSEFVKSFEVKFAGSLNQQLKNDYFGRLKSFLKCEDRCSMAFGIESRVPFADDVELVDFIFSVEGNKKIQQGVSKYLLREATKKFLPQQIYQRKDKIGFETPVSGWLLPNKSIILETIKSQLQFVNLGYIEKNFETICQKKAGFILKLYSFAVWKKLFSSI